MLLNHISFIRGWCVGRFLQNDLYKFCEIYRGLLHVEFFFMANHMLNFGADFNWNLIKNCVLKYCKLSIYAYLVFI